MRQRARPKEEPSTAHYCDPTNGTPPFSAALLSGALRNVREGTGGKDVSKRSKAAALGSVDTDKVCCGNVSSSHIGTLMCLGKGLILQNTVWMCRAAAKRV